MKAKDRIFDDIAQLAGGAAGIIGGLSQNIRAEIKARVEEMIDRLDLVPRADLEALEASLQKTRSEQKELRDRIQTLEKKTKK